MVIWSLSHVVKYRDVDHQEDAPHFSWISKPFIGGHFLNVTSFDDFFYPSWFSNRSLQVHERDEWKNWTTRKWNLDRNRCNTLQLVRIQWVKRRRIFVQKYNILVQVWLDQDNVERPEYSMSNICSKFYHTAVVGMIVDTISEAICKLESTRWYLKPNEVFSEEIKSKQWRLKGYV